MTPPVRDLDTLRAAMSNESNLLSHAYAILQQALPGTLGRVTILHGVKVFPTPVNVSASPWHGCAFAFMYDVKAQNDPQLVEFSADAFHQATGGGMDVYRPEVLLLIFTVNPALEVINLPSPMDPGNPEVAIRFVHPVPFRFVVTLLQQTWTPPGSSLLLFIWISLQTGYNNNVPHYSTGCVPCARHEPTGKPSHMLWDMRPRRCPSPTPCSGSTVTNW
jgi:hypothetical protein